jgi:hypothetical protein
LEGKDCSIIKILSINIRGEAEENTEIRVSNSSIPAEVRTEYFVKEFRTLQLHQSVTCLASCPRCFKMATGGVQAQLNSILTWVTQGGVCGSAVGLTMVDNTQNERVIGLCQ